MIKRLLITLKITWSIVDGSSYEITYYNGFEGVEPPRQSW